MNYGANINYVNKWVVLHILLVLQNQSCLSQSRILKEVRFNSPQLKATLVHEEEDDVNLSSDFDKTEKV